MFDSLAQLVALKEYAYAVQLDEKHGYARRNLVRQLLYIDQYARALQELNAIDSTFLADNPDLYTMRGETLYGLHQYKEAIINFNHALQSGSTAYVLLLRAKAEWKLGRHANACETYISALAMDSLCTSRKEFIDCDTP
jgi:tetratricopeptide (TPR) repeat protein